MCKNLLLVICSISVIFCTQSFATNSELDTASDIIATIAKWKGMTKQQKIEKVFNELSSQNMELLYTFYDQFVLFEDPLGTHKGIDSVRKYYENLYKNVDSIKFDFSNHVCDSNQCVSMWTMHLKAKNLNGGEPIAVIGNSFIKFDKDGKVIYHRDYFDMGEFIYERIPILKNIIKFIKNKLKE